MTEVEAATVRVIAEACETAAKLAGLGDKDGSKSALDRATRRCEQFSADKPWHARAVRLCREAVARATLAVEAVTGEAGRRKVGIRRRATERAVERAKRL